MPEAETDRFRKLAQWDEQSQDYIIPRMELSGNVKAGASVHGLKAPLSQRAIQAY